MDEESAATLYDRQESEGYVYPAYDEACFADIPDAALSILDNRFQNQLPDRALPDETRDIDHVVLLLIDGLGWDQWSSDRRDAPFLDRLGSAGQVTPLTSIYPSETAAAVTTIHTGRTPIEHGLLGWHAYLASVGKSIFTLPFETREGEPITSVDSGTDGSVLFEGEPIYNRAHQAGIETNAVQPASTIESQYTEASLGDADRYPYHSLPDLGVTIRERIQAADGPTYTYAYAPHMDTIAHAVGTDADRYRATISTLGYVLEQALIDELDSTAAANTLLLVTADHGHLNTRPDTRINLADIGGVTDHLARDSNGDPIPPQGGPRNVQFHVRDGQVEPLRTRLETAYPCRTFDRTEYLDAGLFGPEEPSETFEKQAPDLVFVHRDAAVWDTDDGLAHIGVHGGMSRAEMLIPLAATSLADLQS